MAEKTAPSAAKLAELKRRIAADPASRSFLELAREYHEAGLYEEAAAVCAQGLKYHPHYVSARVLLGRVCFDSGLMDEARSHMEGVLAVVPDNLVARRVVAEVCRIQGDLAGALERFHALLAFNAGDEETKTRIREIEASLSAPPPPRPESVEELPPVLEVLPPVLEVLPTVLEEVSPPVEEMAAPESGPLATPTLAEIYLQQGLMQKAIEVYREILKGDPGNLEVILRLSELEPKPVPSPDPAAMLAARKVEALSGWLTAIRRGARA